MDTLFSQSQYQFSPWDFVGSSNFAISSDHVFNGKLFDVVNPISYGLYALRANCVLQEALLPQRPHTFSFDRSQFGATRSSLKPLRSSSIVSRYNHWPVVLVSSSPDFQGTNKN